MRNAIYRCQRQQTGAATLETIIALPVLVIATFGAFQLGITLINNQQSNSAAIQTVWAISKNDATSASESQADIEQHYRRALLTYNTDSVPAIEVRRNPSKLTVHVETERGTQPNFLSSFGLDTTDQQLEATATLPR